MAAAATAPMHAPSAYPAHIPRSLCCEANAVARLTRIQCHVRLYRSIYIVLRANHDTTAGLAGAKNVSKCWSFAFYFRRAMFLYAIGCLHGHFALSLHAFAGVEARSLCSCMNVASEPTISAIHCITRIARANASFRRVRVRDASQNQADTS